MLLLNHQPNCQMMGLRALPRLVVHAPVVAARFRGCQICAVSGLAQPVLDGSSAEILKPLFSSRAKIAEACPRWLRQSRSRSNVEKNFHLEDLYDSDVSSVHIATHKANQEKTVIKMFKRDKLANRVDLQNKVKQEWDVHSSLSHPNIIKSYLALEDSQGVKLFMEYAGESDAYSFISNKQRLCLREADACQLVYDVLTALSFMHGQGIVHRDIKSENVFRTASGVWKLGDFGSSLRIGDKRELDKQTVKLEGTYSFAAPEYITIWDGFNKTQLLEATTFKLDSWSVGALAYDVLCGHAPFAPYEDISRDKEKSAILHLEPEYPSGLSYNAVSFLMQSLEKNRQKRPTVPQLQAHPWFDILPVERRVEQQLQAQ
jgi:aurora kinase